MKTSQKRFHEAENQLNCTNNLKEIIKNRNSNVLGTIKITKINEITLTKRYKNV